MNKIKVQICLFSVRFYTSERCMNSVLFCLKNHDITPAKIWTNEPGTSADVKGQGFPLLEPDTPYGQPLTSLKNTKDTYLPEGERQRRSSSWPTPSEIGLQGGRRLPAFSKGGMRHLRLPEPVTVQVSQRHTGMEEKSDCCRRCQSGRTAFFAPSFFFFVLDVVKKCTSGRLRAVHFPEGALRRRNAKDWGLTGGKVNNRRGLPSMRK